MKIAIAGPGALGSLLAARLSRCGGHELWVLDHKTDRAALLAARGIWLEDQGRQVPTFCRATADPTEVGTVDLLFLCVKSWAVAASLPRLEPLLSPCSLLIAFQNGISHFSILHDRLPVGCWAVGVTAQGATLLGPGRVRHGGTGPTRLGFKAAPVPSAARLGGLAADILTTAGIPAEVDPHIMTAVWRKLLANVGINALTALHNCPNGLLLEDPVLKEQLNKAVQEAAAVARAKGIVLGVDPLEAVIEVCRATGGNISSMLQDVRRGRPTEIDAINGAVAAEGRRLGLAVPVNEHLVRAVKQKEQEYL